MNSTKTTALHRAAKFNRVEIFQIIIDIVEDKNTRNENGETPLHLAAINGHWTIVQIILDKTIDNINSKDDSDDTPLDLAKLYNMEKTQNLILESLKHHGLA